VHLRSRPLGAAPGRRLTRATAALRLRRLDSSESQQSYGDNNEEWDDRATSPHLLQPPVRDTAKARVSVASFQAPPILKNA
jgi:hypothetical protein